MDVPLVVAPRPVPVMPEGGVPVAPVVLVLKGVSSTVDSPLCGGGTRSISRLASFVFAAKIDTDMSLSDVNVGSVILTVVLKFVGCATTVPPALLKAGLMPPVWLLLETVDARPVTRLVM